MGDVSLRDLLDVATEAAYAAGRRALAYYNTGTAYELKADNTPVTMADREAEHMIREAVGKHFPGHAVLGEEMAATPGSNADYRWIIDPIDGTKSFLHGVPMWGVLVAVEVKGRVSVGVCYHPATDELIAAADGLGCRWNGRKARVSSVNSLANSTLLCTSPARAQKRSDAYDKLEERVSLVRSWGDCYGYTMVATGRAEVMLDPAMNPWDCAPFVPILREAGGMYATWAGEETIYGRDGFATNAAMYEEVLAVLRGEQVRGGKSSEDRTRRA